MPPASFLKQIQRRFGTHPIYLRPRLILPPTIAPEMQLQIDPMRWLNPTSPAPPHVSISRSHLPEKGTTQNHTCPTPLASFLPASLGLLCPKMLRNCPAFAPIPLPFVPTEQTPPGLCSAYVPCSCYRTRLCFLHHRIPLFHKDFQRCSHQTPPGAGTRSCPNPCFDRPSHPSECLKHRPESACCYGRRTRN